jgi:hypothetical protein
MSLLSASPVPSSSACYQHMCYELVARRRMLVARRRHRATSICATSICGSSIHEHNEHMYYEHVCALVLRAYVWCAHVVRAYVVCTCVCSRATRVPTSVSCRGTSICAVVVRAYVCCRGTRHMCASYLLVYVCAHTCAARSSSTSRRSSSEASRSAHPILVSAHIFSSTKPHIVVRGHR